MSAILPIDRARLTRELRASARLAAPLVLGQLSAIGMNVIDTLLAGHLNAHTLGAVALGTSVWTLAIVCAIGVMMALPPSVAQLSGAGRREMIGPMFRQALWLATGIGIAIGIGVHFGGRWLLERIGVDPTLVEDTSHFLHAIAFGAPALTFFFALRGLSEGLGLSRPTMYFSLLGLALLGPVGYVLMYGRLGLPALGALGSGIATALVLWVQMIALAIYLGLRHHYRDLHLFARIDRPDPRAMFDLLKIGIPMGVAVFMEASLFVAVALVMGRLGTDVVASHQIAVNVASLAFMVPLGLAMACTVRVGNAVGRGDPAGVRWAAGAGFVLTLLTQSVSAAILFFAPAAIASLYTQDAEVIVVAAQLLVLAGVFQLSDGLQVAANGALRGLKDARMPMLLTTIAYWVVGMPVGLWLTFPCGFGARGMWMGLIAGLTVAAVLLGWRFWRMALRMPARPAVATPMP